MKKKELKELLNKSSDSINLHDSSLHIFNLVNNTLTLTFSIGGYHYLINNLEQYVDDIKNTVILTLRFDGIYNFKGEFYDDFSFEHSNIFDNEEENGVFKLRLTECIYDGNVSFQYKSFEWDVVGEFDDIGHRVWCKEHGVWG